MKDRISIIILIHNSRSWIRKCFDSINCQTYENFEVVVVDNGSRDGSAEFLEENYPGVKVIRAQKNLGFAGGNNLGIKHARGEYVLFLNVDTWIEDDFLEKFILYFKTHDYDVISTLESEYDRKKIKINNFYTSIDPFGYTISRPKKGGEEQFNLCGFCLLTRKDFYLATGGLDDNFFLYIEEIDWFWRLKILGKKAGLDEDLYVYHHGTASGHGKLDYFIFLCRNKNILQMIIKNYSWPNLIWVIPVYLFQNVVEMVFFLALGRFKIAWSYPEGWFFVAMNLPRIIKKRAWVQKRRKVGDLEIMKKFFYFGNAKLIHLISFYKNGK